ncbi:hypothetical protein [Oscillatoria sp. HE19RPO]|jgi:hypothetical protein|uniref:hypothetical protein n=1 Tax=Oscillatoria sp. HE19RPO TaxID=2954806 RepID=UPI0020C44D32|nr:hypothetical protein [Oscillatoria sp. HE19RPO]
MTKTPQEIYIEIVSTLPPTERLKLATLILNGLIQQNAIVDDSDAWTEADQQDLAAFSWQYAATIFPDDEEMAE